MEGRIIPICKPVVALTALTAALVAAGAQAQDYGAFGRARIAAADGDVGAAARQYGIALAGAPGDAVVAGRAFRQAMAAGDLPLARRAAAALGPDAPPDTRLLPLADAVKSGDPKAIDKALAALDKTPFDFFVPVIRAWLALGQSGDPGAALAATERSGAIRHVMFEQRILIEIARDDIPVAAKALEDELRGGSGGLDLRYAAAELLMGQGQDTLAGQLLRGPDPEVATVRGAIRPVKATPAIGIARLFTRIAADLTDPGTTPIAITLAQSALILDPQDGRARLLLAAALERQGAHYRALAVLGEIPPGSGYHTLAGSIRVEVLRAKADMPAAIAAAKALADAPGADAESAEHYGNMLLIAGHPLDAATAFEKSRDRLGADAGWTIWLQIGSAYDKAGRWPLAQAALERAVALGPNQAVVLNYFGYSLVEHGGDVARAVTMLEKANSLAPGQPAIADSLGWAYFRSGDTGRALPLIESAGVAAPADAEIAEHLGDVYWAVGRRYEARYAWRAARVAAKPDAAARLDAKILDGPAATRS
ncbi:MAG: tetratricopeptide repeat protein [Sphingomonas sp.]|uniref:tetratricopeptide repeat protein n=1 Tax=Sphingomonas sp. TaxID=28214 RepID=UPI003F8126D3